MGNPSIGDGFRQIGQGFTEVGKAALEGAGKGVNLAKGAAGSIGSWLRDVSLEMGPKLTELSSKVSSLRQSKNLLPPLTGEHITSPMFVRSTVDPFKSKGAQYRKPLPATPERPAAPAQTTEKVRTRANVTMLSLNNPTDKVVTSPGTPRRVTNDIEVTYDPLPEPEDLQLPPKVTPEQAARAPRVDKSKLPPPPATPSASENDSSALDDLTKLEQELKQERDKGTKETP